MARKVIGIVGSYRKGRIIDTAVSAVLEGAKENGAQTEKIYLTEKNIAFCDNCRECTQEQVDSVRSKCIHKDDMNEILDKIDGSDGVVLGSPVNFFTVTAVMKKFIERLLPYTYWPWGTPAPKNRIKEVRKKTVLIASSACPAFIGRIVFRSVFRILKASAKCFGAKAVKKLYFGGVSLTKDQRLTVKAVKRCKKAGRKLAI